MNTIVIDELVKDLLQLGVLGLLGGAVTWFYAKLQMRHDLRFRVLREFAALHGKFIALRYEFNSFYVQQRSKRSAQFHPLTKDEIRLERWHYFQRACQLIGEFQGLKPVIIESFPKTADDVYFLFSKYQDWRRCIQADRPILQETNGKNEQAYDELRKRYGRVIRRMRSKV